MISKRLIPHVEISIRLSLLSLSLDFASLFVWFCVCVCGGEGVIFSHFEQLFSPIEVLRRL